MKWERIVLSTVMLAVVAVGTMYLFRFHSSRAFIPVSGEYINIENTKLYVSLRGEGQPVLFLHGFPYYSDAFTEVISRPLPGYQCITLDFPGAGFSEKKIKPASSPDDLALMVKLLLDRLDVKQIDLVGHDLGGGVAMVFAASYPQMVRRLVLIAPDSSVGTAAACLHAAWHWPFVGELWAALRLDRGFIRDLLEKSWSPGSTAWNQYVERYTRPLNTEQGRNGFLSLHRGRIGFDYLPHEERLQGNCLLIWGEKDQITPSAAGERLMQRINRCQLQVIPGVGHLPHEEAPEEVHRRIRDFLLSTEKPEAQPD
ncbi:alpha/beta hydrolase [candidate division FCPU426 bacterium]|nr:alpha/beta hydrolase [candidate division FCPU426 bacterium]